jgi:taurine dioxygenase
MLERSTELGVTIERPGAAVGAFIHGIDLSQPLDEPRFDFIKSALLEYHAVCVRNQRISPEQHIALTRRFGEVVISGRGMREYPEIGEVGGPAIAVERWHSDATYALRPLALALMVARSVPKFGEDLILANQHTAYDLLSPALQRMLAPLRAIHRNVLKSGEGEQNTHPVIRTHPVTARPALYVNSQYTQRFEGMSEEESAPLLEYLCRHCTQPRLTWRHYWQEGDVLLWDNSNIQHYVVRDALNSPRRIFHRTSTVGDAPFYAG